MSCQSSGQQLDASALTLIARLHNTQNLAAWPSIVHDCGAAYLPRLTGLGEITCSPTVPQSGGAAR